MPDQAHHNNLHSSDAHSSDAYLNQPPRIPQTHRQAGGWTSAQEHAGTPEPAPPAMERTFTDQSLIAIRTICEALEEPQCNQIDSYGPALFSALVHGAHREMRGVKFASNDEYHRLIELLVVHANSVVTWNSVRQAGHGVLQLPTTTTAFLRRLLEDNGRPMPPPDRAKGAPVASRLTIFLSPPGQHTTISIRKHTTRSVSGESFVEQGILDQRMWNFLVAAVQAKANILIVGEMGSGKTTLLRALARHFGENEKIAVVEEIPELHLPRKFVVPYTFQPTIEGMDVGTIIDRNLYNGVNRLIVGETHLEGITRMLETMIFTKGSMSTYHAFSAEAAGERMKLALQLENPNVTVETAASMIRQAVEIIVVIQMVSGRRRVIQITEVDWRASAGKDMLGGRDLFRYEPGDQSTPGRFVAVNHPDPRGRVATRARNDTDPPVRFDERWFLEPEQLREIGRL